LSFGDALGNNWFSAVHMKIKLLYQLIGRMMQSEKSFQNIVLFTMMEPTLMGQTIAEKNTENKIIGYVGFDNRYNERKTPRI
jgi:hypothetical protein